MIEATESFSRKDYKHRIKICRKEAKESIMWLKLVDNSESTLDSGVALIQEATELMRIFGAILEKLKDV